MKALLVYPEYPETFWNFRYALKFISKKATYPPLGLLTVAAMLPLEWEKKLIDMNVNSLRDEDLQWADIVCLSAASIQRKSVDEIIQRCQNLGKTMVAGGPLFTSDPDAYSAVDHLVLNEAEVTLPSFINDLERGDAQHIYTSTQLADLGAAPTPLWSLVNTKDYAAMNIQVSRGCPYDCEFCNITSLFGRVPRVKGKDQVIAELESIYRLGWRGGVFVVDDNFIGSKAKVKKEILPAMIEWMQQRNYPFTFNSQVPVNLADDVELMDLMTQAGFATVFIGIESPDEACLNECNKIPNRNRDLIASVNLIQRSGLEVQAGFIVGFDSDTTSVFDRLISFIQKSGIVTAMVGILCAPRGTRLYERLTAEGRLACDMTGNNTDANLNFIPKMAPETLIEGYHHIVEDIYSPNLYYERVKEFLRKYRPVNRPAWRFKWSDIFSLFRLTINLGMIEKERTYYWRLLLWSLFNRPRLLPMALVYTAYGFHFRKSFEQR